MRSSPRRLGLPAILLLGVLLTSAATAAAVSAERRSVQLALIAEAEGARGQLQARIDELTTAQRLLRQSMRTHWPITRDEFRTMTLSDGTSRAFSGVQAVSFNRLVPLEELAAYEAQVRSDTTLDPDGYPSFAVVPEETDFDDRIVIEYIEPFASNADAFGFDVGSNVERREAIEQARDTGELIATEPLTLVQPVDGDERRGILMISPVYDTGELLVSAPSRRRHFVGVIVTVVDLDRLLGESIAPAPGVELELYDLGETSQQAAGPDGGTLIYDSDGVPVPDGSVGLVGGASRLDLDVGGRRWSLVAIATTGAVPASVLAVLLTGLAATAALVGAAAAGDRARRTAEDLVTRRTADLRAVLAHAPEATVVVDADGVIVLASERVRSLLGYDPDDLVGEPVEHLLAADLREHHRALRDAFAPDERPRTMGEGADLHARHADGHEVDVEVILSKLPAGSMGAVVVSLRDVGVQRRAIADLTRANELKNAFLSTVSHELKTPLTAIRGFAHLLGRSPGPPQELREEMTERIIANAESLKNLIDEVLDFSRLERSALDLSPERTELNAAVRAIMARITPVTRAHDVVVDGEACHVDVDPNALERIVINLVTNAVRYAPPATRIVATTAIEGAQAVLMIDDEGPGIPAAEREMVFEQFWRGESARRTTTQGTGVGLAVVAELMQLSGGDASIEDAPGGGARIRLVFPLVAAPSAAVSGPPA